MLLWELSGWTSGKQLDREHTRTVNLETAYRLPHCRDSGSFSRFVLRLLGVYLEPKKIMEIAVNCSLFSGLNPKVT